MRRMLITLIFYFLLGNYGLFPVSHIQLMSRCAGAGRKDSQAASSSSLMEVFHIIGVILKL